MDEDGMGFLECMKEVMSILSKIVDELACIDTSIQELKKAN